MPVFQSHFEQNYFLLRIILYFISVCEQIIHVVKPGRLSGKASRRGYCSVCKQTKTEKYKYVPGDVDRDDHISAADARLALRRAVGLETYEKNSPQFLSCDADHDSNVSASDARMILRASVGLEDPKAWSK